MAAPEPKSAERQRAVAEVQRLADEFGVRPNELKLSGWLARKGKKPQKKAGAHSRASLSGIEYVSEDGSQRWVPGLGRPPRWIQAAADAGALDQLARERHANKPER